MTSIRVLIAEDHPVMRGGLRALLEARGFDVVGEAADGAEAVALAASLRPDVVLMDIEMPDHDGITATAELVRHDPDAKVLVLTMHAGVDVVTRALRAGAVGYLVKGSPTDRVVGAVQAVAEGQVVFDAAIAGHVLADLRRDRGVDDPFPELTAREREVFGLLGLGLNNRAIAERLGLSVKTVANNVSNVFAKLHLADRAAAVVRSRESGLGPG